MVAQAHHVWHKPSARRHKHTARWHQPTAWWHKATTGWRHTTRRSLEHGERLQEHMEHVEHATAARTTHHSGGPKVKASWVYASGRSRPARCEANRRVSQ